MSALVRLMSCKITYKAGYFREITAITVNEQWF